MKNSMGKLNFLVCASVVLISAAVQAATFNSVSQNTLCPCGKAAFD